MSGDSKGNGFDFSQFTETIKQLERLGADMSKVANRVLDAGSEPARQAFVNNVLFDTTTPEGRRQHEHARDHVVVSKTKTASRSKNKYRIIGADDGKSATFSRQRQAQKEGSNRRKRSIGSSKTAEGNTFDYLYMAENGTTRAPAHPFIDKAYRAAQTAASEPMKQALLQEIDNHLR